VSTNGPSSKSLRRHQPTTTTRSPLYASLGIGLPDLKRLRAELDLYNNWMLKRIDLPNGDGIGSYHETAVAGYVRGQEMAQLILRMEADGTIVKGSALTKFRTGELRHFLEAASKAVDRGSREITAAQLAVEGMRLGL